MALRHGTLQLPLCSTIIAVQVKVEANALEPKPYWSFEHIKLSFEKLSNGKELKEEAFFNGPCVLDTSCPKVTLAGSRESVWCTYKLTIWTATTKHAGTDADIKLQIQGSHSVSAVLKVC